MKKRAFFLFVIGLLISSILTVFAQWVEYGSNQEATHHLPATNNSGFEFNSLNLSIGQDFELVIADIVGDNKLEMLLWNDTKLELINLSSGTSIAAFSLNARLLGHPTYYNNRYYAIVSQLDAPTGAYFYEIFVNSSSYNVTYNFSINEDLNLGRSEGVKCTLDNGVNYCLFMDRNSTIYRVNLDNNTYTQFPTTDRKLNNINGLDVYGNHKRVPAIGDIGNDGNKEAVFSIVNVTTNRRNLHLFVYKIHSNTSLTTFGDNGYKNLMAPPEGYGWNVTNPLLHDFDGGGPEIVVAHENVDGVLGILAANGTILASSSGQYGGNGKGIATQPAINKCKFPNSASLSEGISILASTTEQSGYAIVWIASNYSAVARKSFSCSSTCIKFGQELVSLDFINLDNEQELLSTIKFEVGDYKQSILNCSNATLFNLTSGETDVKNFAVADYDKDGYHDIISTSLPKTSIFTFNPSNNTDVEILEVIPIQVVRDVDMVLGKTGLVRVNVRNNGPSSANASVTVRFEGNLLYNWDNSSELSVRKSINITRNESFDFRFIPGSAGNQTFVANVSVS